MKNVLFKIYYNPGCVHVERLCNFLNIYIENIFIDVQKCLYLLLCWMGKNHKPLCLLSFLKNEMTIYHSILQNFYYSKIIQISCWHIYFIYLLLIYKWSQISQKATLGGINKSIKQQIYKIHIKTIIIKILQTLKMKNIHNWNIWTTQKE